MGAKRGAVLVVFVDGVGLGPEDPSRNPLAAAPLPTIRSLLEGRPPVAATASFEGARATLRGVDACFGHPGLPQSGTGHASLLVGEDAVARFGRPFGPWVPTALRGRLRERSLLARARSGGVRVAFANAYPEGLVRAATQGSGDRPARKVPLPLRTGPVIAALGAGVLDRHTRALAEGRAVASEIVNDGWRTRLGRDVPDITPETAGRNLAAIAAEHDLTLFAHYATDTAGHRRSLEEGVTAATVVDRFLSGILAALPDGLAVLVVSDHGNLEDVSGGHTRNPALALALGSHHRELLDGVESLADVAPRVLERVLGRQGPPGGSPGPREDSGH